MTPKVSERQIQDACSQLMELDDWRVIHTDPRYLRGLGVQEKGIADECYVRYLANDRLELQTELGPVLIAVLKPPAAEVLWVEFKRRTGKAMAHQRAWHDAERARGALTWIAGIDFTASVEGFKAHYLASGLARRVR